MFVVALRIWRQLSSSEAMSKKYLGETLDIHGGGLGNPSRVQHADFQEGIAAPWIEMSTWYI